jgi:hypothetical protein
LIPGLSIDMRRKSNSGRIGLYPAGRPFKVAGEDPFHTASAASAALDVLGSGSPVPGPEAAAPNLTLRYRRRRRLGHEFLGIPAVLYQTEKGLQKRRAY